MAVLLIGLFTFHFLKEGDAKKKIDLTNTPKEPYLESYFNNKNDYEDSFTKYENVQKEKVLAGITNHHFLAKNLIAQFYSGIDSSNVTTVIIAGPDHYQRLTKTQYLAETTDTKWQTPFGVMEPATGKILSITKNKNVYSNVDDFRLEHSVYTLIPFTKKEFPNAMVIPLILRAKPNYDAFYNLGEEFSKLVERDRTVLIISSDFSHQVSESLAKENDFESIRSLIKMDIGSIDKIESDCKQCIAFLYGFLKNTPSRFRLIDNKTSLDFGSQEKQNLTSYINGYFVRDDIRILFGGDFMFDRYIRQLAKDKGNDFILQNIKGYLLDKDLVVVNLEGPITLFDSISIGTKIGTKNNYIFTFHPSAAETLLNHNIKLVNIGNNHSFDFGDIGLSQTKQFLSNKNINYFGNTKTNDNSTKFQIIELKGKKIAFVNYNQFAEKGLEASLTDINQTKDKSDFIVVYAHWGDEYSKQIKQSLRELAHQLIDAGADIIIGSHPHVIREKEVYRGKMVYYSLGNFVFDQYFREDTQRGLLLELSIDLESNAMQFLEHPIILHENGQTTLSN